MTGGYGVPRRPALLASGLAAVASALTACGGGGSAPGASIGAQPDTTVIAGHGIGAAPQAFRLPVSTESPTAFVPGDAATERLPSGQEVTLTVIGPAVANPVAGKSAQFAAKLRETFTVTASLAGGAPVTFTPGDFAVHHDGVDSAVTGPASVVITAGAARTWTLSAIQTPGAGALHWRVSGGDLARWDYVAEND